MADAVKKTKQEPKWTDDQKTLVECSYLLSYPTANWRRALADGESSVQDIENPHTRAVLTDFYSYIHELTPEAYEDQYVRSFDFSPNTTLYLTAHDCTDFGKQSKELLAYRQFYLENGYDSPQDLPDYLPALLELIAALPEERAAEVCRFAQPKLSRLRERLIEANLSYAFLLDLVLATAERLEASA